MSVHLVWQTPEIETLLMKIARVSSDHEDSGDVRLIQSLIRNEHWSPFEMVNLCFEIYTTRDIGRQILRHRSFCFQEYSQRYAEVSNNPLILREARTPDSKKRQISHSTNDSNLLSEWKELQEASYESSQKYYKRALEIGIAKEQARVVLPEGLTQTRMYINGTLRSWIHYVNLRCGHGTQKEHSELANQIQQLLINIVPNVSAALGWKNKIN